MYPFFLAQKDISFKTSQNDKYGKELIKKQTNKVLQRRT